MPGKPKAKKKRGNASKTRKVESAWRKSMKRVFLLSAAAVLTFAAYDLGSYVVSSDLFLVRKVRVRGNFLIGKKEIVYGMDLPSRTRLWQVSPEEIESRLLKMSLIESVEVKRVLPETLVVDLTERIPSVDWTDSETGKRFVVDNEGAVLLELEEFEDRLAKSGKPDAFGVRPILEGVAARGKNPGDRLGVEDLDRVLSALSVAQSREERWLDQVESLVYLRDGRGWSLRCRGGIGEVRLGSRRFIERLGSVAPIHRFLEDERVEVEYVDLRFEEQGVLIRPENCDPRRWLEIADRNRKPKAENEERLFALKS